MSATIVYLAHDLSDPALHRRVRMLVAGGAVVTPIGFRRSAEPPNAVEGLRPIALGRTADGMLARRMLSVAGSMVRLGSIAEHARKANVIVARNLEMLVLAIRARKLYAPEATVVYECLDIHRMLLYLPYVRFAGPYRNPADLPGIYGDVHFSCAIDYYESGQNSAWLLPNRVYEGSLYGAVPIGLAGVETGRWLAKRSAGVVLDEPLEQRLVDFFRRLDRNSYAILAHEVEALPRTDLVSDQSDCRELVEALCPSSAGHALAFPAHDVESVAIGQRSNRIGA
jgi:hypothetical protein